ncbi:MAG TPA: carbamoyl phosphate synthase large subunit, partial [Gammaproteobacteria bacterium]|nr:carbamoyl phosphate synthase large subunit [Gammaproteobacteria bacterium]
VDVARQLTELGFKLVATGGTARMIKDAGLEVKQINKVKEGRPHIVDAIKNKDVDLIVNTTEGTQAVADSYHIRREALQNKVAYTTTITGAQAICAALNSDVEIVVRRLQDLHAELLA